MRDNDPHSDPHDVSKETLKDIIKNAIQENPHITRAQIAVRASVSVKTVARKLKEMTYIKYVGSGNNGHWEISDPQE